MHSIKSTRLVVTTLSVLALCAAAFAQDAPPPSDKKVTYSPYPQQDFPNRVFFGDTHLHTSYSTDAGMIGNTSRAGGGVSLCARRDGEIQHRIARAARSAAGFPGRGGSLRKPGPRAHDRRIEPGAARVRVGPQGSRPGQGRQGLRGVRRLGCGDDRVARIRSRDRRSRARRGSASPLQRRNTTSRVASPRSLATNGLRRPTATICIASSFIATPRTRPIRSCPSRSTTASIPKTSGNGWPTTRGEPAAGCLPSRTTAIFPTGSCSTTSLSRPKSRSTATMRCGARSGSRCTK